ncbi:hypothetical protein SprV_0401455100 [Sparganum proliferum]
MPNFRGISSFKASHRPAVQLLDKYPGFTAPNFSFSAPAHDIVHHIRSTGPPSRFAPNCTNTILPLTNLLSGAKDSFELSPSVLAAFDKMEAALADDTLLTHSAPDAPISLSVGASNMTVDVVLRQHFADLTEMAAEQRRVGSARDKDVYGPQLQALPPIIGDGTIISDISTTSYRLSVPPLRFH